MTSTPAAHVRDVAVFIKGKKASVTLNSPSHGALPYVLIEGFGGAYKTFTNDPGAVRCYRDDTIVVADGANTGLTSASHDGYLGSTLGALRPDKAKINHRYLFYFVHGNFNMLNTRTRGAAVPHLDKQLLLDLEFALPPLPEQERIVAILDAADELRCLREKADRRTADLIPALFHEMFGDPATNPKGLPICRVEQAGEVQLGRQRAPKYQSGKWTRPYLRVANVFEDRIDLSDLLSMDFDEKDCETYRLAGGDILLNEGQSTELVGRPAMWRDEKEGCCFQNTLVRFRGFPNKAIPEFALAVFLTYYRSGDFSKISSKTSNVAHLGAGRFSRMPFPLPSLSLQRNFAARVAGIRAMETNQAASRRRLDDLFQSLLQRAFRGEL